MKCPYIFYKKAFTDLRFRYCSTCIKFNNMHRKYVVLKSPVCLNVRIVSSCSLSFKKYILDFLLQMLVFGDKSNDMCACFLLIDSTQSEMIIVWLSYFSEV